MASSRSGRPLPLVVGDPNDRVEVPFSFSRFVLPFGHCVEEVAGPAEATTPYYRRLDLDEELDPRGGRRHYLTREISKALFNRTAWFELTWEEGAKPDLDFTVHGREGGRSDYRVRIEPPRLALFEWQEATRRDGERDHLATGFLIVDLTFPDPDRRPTLTNLLELNEIFRIWSEPFKGHDEERHYSEILADCPLDLRDGSGRIGDLAADSEKDRYLDRWVPLFEPPLASTVRRGGKARAFLLFPERRLGWTDQVRNWERDPLTEDPGWAIYADNRAFVWTAALVPNGAHTLTDGREDPAEPSWTRGEWIKLVNVDLPGSSPGSSTAFEREWIEERTYRRWAEHGTLYGFTYHSGAMLGPPEETFHTDRHFREHYFDQTLLLLYLRVTSLRLSERLSEATAKLRDEPEAAGWEEAFGRLREDFAVFTNLYEFPRVSNQEQGIEMYALAREVLDVKDFFEEIEEEVRSAHELAEMRATQRESRLVGVLTLIATLAVPFAVVTSFFGMNVLIDTFFSGTLGHEAEAVGLLLVAGFLATWLILRIAWRHHEGVERLIFGSVKSRSRKEKRS